MSGWGGRWGSQPGSLDARFKAHEAEQRFARVEEVMEARRRTHREAAPIGICACYYFALHAGEEFAKPGDVGSDSSRATTVSDR